MPDVPSLDFVPPLGLARGPSFLIDVALLGLALGAFVIALAVHARRLARAAARERAALASPSTLRAGAATVLTGTIEALGQDGPPVSVVVEERLVADSWIERTRRVDARPFELAVDGARVHVEAGPEVFVAAALEPGPVLLPGQRQSRLVLEHGTRIVAYGTLSRERQAFAGYRGGAAGFTLRAPKRGRLLLVTESLESRYTTRIRVLNRFAAVALLVWLSFHALWTLPFLVASFGGVQTSTRLVSAESVGRETARQLHTETDDGLVLTSKVTMATAQELNLRGASSVPLLRFRSWPRASFVGGEAWTSAPAVLGGLCVALVALAALRLRYRLATPWYDRG